MTLLFQVSGMSIWNSTAGALGSTGLMLPVTLQYEPVACAPEPEAATGAAAVTTAPVVGRPMEVAGTFMPSSCAQLNGVPAGDDESHFGRTIGLRMSGGKRQRISCGEPQLSTGRKRLERLLTHPSPRKSG
jgi:hypothetical protein